MAKPSQENFYKRLNELAGNKSKVNETITGTGTLIDFQKSDEGTIYGIVKENHSYFIKKSNSQNQQLDPSDFAYIGGLENKHLYEYHSVGEAKKHRNFVIKSLNEAFSLKPTNIVAEEKKEEKIENPFDFIKGKINEGKVGNKKKFEERFKKSLTTNIVESTKKNGLMPEQADLAVKKALGIQVINEEESPLVTADSEVEGQDVLPNKVNQKHEPSQAPINDTNAKTIADGNKGKQGSASLPNNAEASPESDPFDDKEDAGDEKGDIVSEKDITTEAVSGLDKLLNEEESPLVTADSEVDAKDVLPNRRDKKESAQAPINDTNAKKIADGNDASGKPSAAIVNNVEASPESDPFTEKENAGDEKGDIVSEKNITEGKINEEESPLVTADSEVEGQDVLPNIPKKHEPAQAPINDTNAKTIADTNKGKPAAQGTSLPNQTEASPESDPFVDKEDAGDETDDIVSEAIDYILKKNLNEEESPLVTADSEVEGGDVLPNQKDKKESSQADVNDENAKTKADSNDASGTPSAAISNNVEQQPESDPFDDKENAGDEKGDIVSEKDITTEAAQIVNSLLTEDTDEIDAQLKAQDAALNVADEIGAEEPAPEAPPAPEPEMGAEMGGEVADDFETADTAMPDDPAADAALDVGGEVAPEIAGDELGDEMGDMGAELGSEIETGEVDPNGEMGEEGGGLSDEELGEVKSKLGEIGEIVRGKEIDNSTVVELVNTGIEPFNTENLEHNDQLKIQNKLKGEEGDGEDLPPEAEPEGDPMGDEMGGELPGPDGGMPDLGGEEIEAVPEAAEVGAEEGCSECGPFDGYAQSRGYDDVGNTGGMELANLLSGYATAHGEGQNDGDFGKVIILLTPEIRDEMMGYGHDEYLGQADQFAQDNPADEETLSPGSFDIEVPTDDIGGEEEAGLDSAEAEVDAEVSDDEGTATVDAEVETNDEPPVEENINEVENIDELNWQDVKNFGAGVAGLGKDAGQAVGQKMGQAQQWAGDKMQQGVDTVKAGAQKVSQGYNKHAGNQQINAIQKKALQLGDEISKFNNFATKAGKQPIPIQSIIMQINSQLKKGAENIDLQSRRMEGEESQQPVVEFAPTSQNLGVAMPSKTGMVSIGEAKIRKYVKNRLEELSGKRKQTISESQKPESLKNLDKMIEAQWKSSQVKK